MEKKNFYDSPNLEVLEIETEGLIAVSLSESDLYIDIEKYE